MQHLGLRDLRAVLDCLRMTYATLDLEAFPRQVIAALRQVVHAPFGSYNEINHGADRIRYIVEPADAMVPNVELMLRQYLKEQPMLAYYQRTGDGSPRKLSDFMTREEFHRLAIYNENYRHTGVEYQIALVVQSLQQLSPLTIAIALDRNRSESDFSERDRFMLTLLRPHLMTAYANAETVSDLRCRTPATNTLPETRRREIIVLRPNNHDLISPRAKYWFAQYFGLASSRGGQLPEALQRWTQEQTRHLGSCDRLPSLPSTMVIEGAGTRLYVRLIPDSPESLLVLEQERTAVDYGALQKLGLTPREAEVLHWVAEGKTNPEIGTILHASPRTVGKHLERIFAKLDVETRTAAAACARR